MDFSPNLSPKDVIQLGSFGGIYFYDNGGKLAIDSNEFPRDWFQGLDESQYKSQTVSYTHLTLPTTPYV